MEACLPERSLIDRIYEAAFDDDSFAELPAMLAKRFGARSALIHWIHNDGDTDVLSHSGYFTDAQLADYAGQFASIDPWVEAASRVGQVNVVMDLEELVPLPEFTSSDFYNDYVRPMGDDTSRCLGIRLHNGSGSGYLALQRGLTQKRFGARTQGSLGECLPHLSAMLSIRGKIAAARHEAAEMTSALDALGLPMFLVDAELRIKRINAAAEDLLAKEEALCWRGGRLAAESPHAEESLRGAIMQAIGERIATAVAIRCEGRAAIQLTIAPTPTRNNALVIGNSRNEVEDSRPARLRRLFRLSIGEAALAVMLADGCSPAEIAEMRRVSAGTVRVQIKTIAAKLGCNRQSEIVRVVASLPPLFTLPFEN